MNQGNLEQPSSDSNYEEDQEDLYEEVGFDEYNQKYDEDEGEIIIQQESPSQPVAK